MDSGWVAAIATVVTALIVAATTVAAFRQLRHGRNANDMVLYLRLIDMMDAPEMMEARAMLPRLAERVRADAVYRERLRDRDFVPDEMRGVGTMLRALEHIAVLMMKGGIAEEIVLAEYADTFVDIWEHIRPAMNSRRVAFGPHTGRAFEHLAMRAKRYIDSGAMDREYRSLARDPQLVVEGAPAR